jgi:predicted TIM-barrel enzyme
MAAMTRQQIRNRFTAKVARRSPLILGGAGIGLVAKAADRAGIDALMAYNTGPFRMDGHGSLPVVKTAPVIAGIGAADPYRNTDQLITALMDAGYSGITNVPTAGIYDGTFRQHIDATGLGYSKEIELIAECDRRDIFTVAYAFTPEEAAAMATAGADVIGAHVGLTMGGFIGANEVPDLMEASERVAAMTAAAKAARPDVWVVAHGGPFDEPENIQAVYDRVDVDGFLGASSIERLPVEKAITETVEAFRSLKLRER